MGTFGTDGSYTGNGALSQTIPTGLSGEIISLDVWCLARGARVALSAAPATGSGIAFLGADFVVSADFNVVGLVYWYRVQTR